MAYGLLLDRLRRRSQDRRQKRSPTIIVVSECRMVASGVTRKIQRNLPLATLHSLACKKRQFAHLQAAHSTGRSGAFSNFISASHSSTKTSFKVSIGIGL